MPPPITPKTAKVVYRAVLALLAAVGSTWPPPPMPERALNMPGQQKQTRPMRETWTKGELYLNLDLAGSCWVLSDSSSPSKPIEIEISWPSSETAQREGERELGIRGGD